MRKVYITTNDNPFDPQEDFVSWFVYDVTKGYNTCELLATYAKTSNSLSEKEYNDEVEYAINQIIADDPYHIYKKITKNN